MAHHLDRLVAHMGWADRLVLESLRDAASIPPMILELYAHVLAAEEVWLARLTGTTPRVAVWPALSLEQCATLAAENRDRLAAYAAPLDATDLGRGISYKNSAGEEFTSTIEDILLHVALHGAYHRGQIAAGLREHSATPAPTDFIAFARGAAAARRPQP